MSELVERYVHQVGLYVNPRERADIEAELRSQIEDQLEDRFGATPSPAELSAVLAEMGDPWRIAVSYNGERYLVGPDLYPFLMTVMRYGWLIIPSAVIFLNLFAELTSNQRTPLLTLLGTTLITSLQTTLIFSAIVVLFFAIIQHTNAARRGQNEPFDPAKLPTVSDPRSVDRVEASFGIAIGILVSLLMLYFLQVGGLTLRFNLSDPGEVIPVPPVWIGLLLAAVAGQVITHLVMLRRNRWSIGLWVIETLLEMAGVLGLYFVLYRPVLAAALANNPALADVPLIVQLPAIIVVINGLIILLSKGVRLVRLWQQQQEVHP